MIAQLEHFFTMHRQPLACPDYITNHTQPSQTLPERPKHELSMEIRYRRKPRTAEERVYVCVCVCVCNYNYTVIILSLFIQQVLNQGKQTYKTQLTRISKA